MWSGKLEIYNSTLFDINQMSGNPCLYKEAHLAFDDIYWNLTSRSYFVDVPDEEICQVKDDRFLVLNDVNYFDSEKYCQMLGFKMPTRKLLKQLDSGMHII